MPKRVSPALPIYTASMHQKHSGNQRHVLHDVSLAACWELKQPAKQQVARTQRCGLQRTSDAKTPVSHSTCTRSRCQRVAGGEAGNRGEWARQSSSTHAVVQGAPSSKGCPMHAAWQALDPVSVCATSANLLIPADLKPR
jgi:hypothetical protein